MRAATLVGQTGQQYLSRRLALHRRGKKRPAVGPQPSQRPASIRELLFSARTPPPTNWTCLVSVAKPLESSSPMTSGFSECALGTPVPLKPRVRQELFDTFCIRFVTKQPCRY